MEKDKDNQIKYGIISESYQYSMDGEYCSGYKEFDVTVTEYWKTGELKNYPKEVKIKDTNKYYRMTKQHGWRIYYKIDKTFDKRNSYIGGYSTFIPNVNVDYSKSYNKVNLGDW